ncbi:MAG: transcriptional regulator [Clostridia bacterium]|nr:transcriptional regulator [Clostridia bacterium]
MMTLYEKAAYLRGLADGVDLDKTTPEGKILAALLDLVTDIADEVEAINEDIADLQDYVEEIDEDLEDVEDFLDEECDGDCATCDCEGDCDDCEFGDYDLECDCDCDDDDCDCDCDDMFFEVECPSCGEVVCFDETIDPENLACPACGEKFTCEFVEEDEEEDAE